MTEETISQVATVPQETIQEIKKDAVKAAQEALIERLGGGQQHEFSWEKQGRQAPSNYQELFSEIEQRMPKMDPELIQQEVEKRLQKEKEAEHTRLQEEAQKQHQTIEMQRKQFDSEWYQLVQEGKLPAVSQELQEKINKNERLTPEEIDADEGLQARLKLYKVSQSNKKSAKLAFYEDFNADQPAGANAPVFGVRPSVAKQSPGEYSYDEVVAARRSNFGF